MVRTVHAKTPELMYGTQRNMIGSPAPVIQTIQVVVIFENNGDRDFDIGG